MDLLYPFFIAFTLVFFSELGDKTQLLVLSFSNKNKTTSILLGVAIGTFLSHGFAILFGSRVAYFSSSTFQFYLKIITYATFILFGVIGFLTNKSNKDNSKSYKSSFLQKFNNLKLGCILMVALCILVGELGDKTFLASLSLGFQYPDAKLPLILGSVTGMVLCNFIVIVFGKLIGNHIKSSWIEFFSNFIFIVFGVLGFISIVF